MPTVRGLVGVFSYLDDVLDAIERLQQEKVAIRNVYSPTKRPEILEAMKTRPSRIRLVSLVAAIVGGCSGLALASYAHLRWRLITSGKPILPWIPWVIIFFEVLVLVSVLSTVASLLIAARIPRLRYAKGGYSPRFTEDRYGVEVFADPGTLDRARVIMHDSGAEEVNEI
jgi:hypothetical protein